MTSAVLATPQVSSDEALRIARTDAEQAYRDLAAYRVTLRLRPDGLHVDYEPDNEQLQGGGPHYGIDSTNGEITSKIYEQ